MEQFHALTKRCIKSLVTDTGRAGRYIKLVSFCFFQWHYFHKMGRSAEQVGSPFVYTYRTLQLQEVLGKVCCSLVTYYYWSCWTVADTTWTTIPSKTGLKSWIVTIGTCTGVNRWNQWDIRQDGLTIQVWYSSLTTWLTLDSADLMPATCLL